MNSLFVAAFNGLWDMFITNSPKEQKRRLIRDRLRPCPGSPHCYGGKIWLENTSNVDQYLAYIHSRIPSLSKWEDKIIDAKTQDTDTLADVIWLLTDGQNMSLDNIVAELSKEIQSGETIVRS